MDNTLQGFTLGIHLLDLTLEPEGYAVTAAALPTHSPTQSDQSCSLVAQWLRDLKSPTAVVLAGGRSAHDTSFCTS